ncbi:MAG TPA: hypothetical protein VGJ55_18170 [Pyrinomonadaceae bacterium]|jgi:hypothetical protein
MPTEVPFLNVAAAYGEMRSELDTAAQRVMKSGQYIPVPEGAAGNSFQDVYLLQKRDPKNASGLGSLT